MSALQTARPFRGCTARAATAAVPPRRARLLQWRRGSSLPPRCCQKFLAAIIAQKFCDFNELLEKIFAQNRPFLEFVIYFEAPARTARFAFTACFRCGWRCGYPSRRRHRSPRGRGRARRAKRRRRPPPCRPPARRKRGRGLATTRRSRRAAARS